MHDEKLGLFRLNRVLFAGVSFPVDIGFIPGTRGGDGDPLEVLGLMDEPAFPGCLVRARAIGVLRATKDGKANHRVIAVSLDAKGWSVYRDLADLPRTMVNEIERFFGSIQIEEHALLGFRNAEAAERVIEGALAARSPPPGHQGARETVAHRWCAARD